MLDMIIARIGIAAVIANVILCTVAIMVILVTIRMVRKEGITKLNNIATILPTALDSISYSEISVHIIAAIATCMKIPLNEIIKEYEEASVKRRFIALETFHSDSLTWKLIWKFPSKFVTYGYIGEELIIKETQTH
ncbi:hypothetical protein LOAG_00010 [Loa loa]|uniref:Uncharacterized protein n=1 Tax=Loa loa TaxID=7209 RepID=A0A1S0UCR7_LOALO|nr:hypothetical protein LOAG_00010 [Loa loa]EFO28466.1 hypothetical protein LOAG_00010 [Loa loa]